MEGGVVTENYYSPHQNMVKCGRSVSMTNDWAVFTCSNGINIHKYGADDKWPTTTSSFTYQNSVYTYNSFFQTPFYYCNLPVHGGVEANQWDCRNFQTERFADAVVTIHNKWMALTYPSNDDEMVRGVTIYRFTEGEDSNTANDAWVFDDQIRQEANVGTGLVRFGTDVAMNDNVLVVGTQRHGAYVFTRIQGRDVTLNSNWNADWVNMGSRIDNNQKPRKGSVSAWGLNVGRGVNINERGEIAVSTESNIGYIFAPTFCSCPVSFTGFDTIQSIICCVVFSRKLLFASH